MRSSSHRRQVARAGRLVSATAFLLAVPLSSAAAAAQVPDLAETPQEDPPEQCGTDEESLLTAVEQLLCPVEQLVGDVTEALPPPVAEVVDEVTGAVPVPLPDPAVPPADPAPDPAPVPGSDGQVGAAGDAVTPVQAPADPGQAGSSGTAHGPATSGANGASLRSRFGTAVTLQPFTAPPLVSFPFQLQPDVAAATTDETTQTLSERTPAELLSSVAAVTGMGEADIVAGAPAWLLGATAALIALVAAGNAVHTGGLGRRPA